MIETLKLVAEFFLHIGFVILALWCAIGIAVIPACMIRAWWKDTHHED